MYGPRAVSEQALTEQILDRLPDGSVLMGDITFVGIPVPKMSRGEVQNRAPDLVVARHQP